MIGADFGVHFGADFGLSLGCFLGLLLIQKYEKYGISGMICGRAIYDKKIDIVKALKIVRA